MRSRSTEVPTAWCSPGANAPRRNRSSLNRTPGRVDMPDVMPLIVIILIVVLVKIVASSIREKRRRAIADVAQRFGLSHSPVDGLGLVDHSFDLYNLGDGAACHEVVWGDWHGVPV